MLQIEYSSEEKRIFSLECTADLKDGLFPSVFFLPKLCFRGIEDTMNKLYITPLICWDRFDPFSLNSYFLKVISQNFLYKILSHSLCTIVGLPLLPHWYRIISTSSSINIQNPSLFRSMLYLTGSHIHQGIFSRTTFNNPCQTFP